MPQNCVTSLYLVAAFFSALQMAEVAVKPTGGLIGIIADEVRWQRLLMWDNLSHKAFGWP